MSENILLSLGLIVLLGFSAQWISWKIKIPSILLLLIFGITAGPVLGLINPDEMFGEVLIPFISFSVAIILFQGGLTLKLSEFRKIGRVVSLLISIGVIITWITATMAAHWLFGLNIEIAILLGAVLTVTGPTVIGPLLRNIRPRQNVSNILKWEGILIDPIGALLAILVFEVILIGKVDNAAPLILLNMLKTILMTTIIGGGFALLLTLIMKKYWVPDYLQEIAALSFVVAAFLISNHFQEESGLLATTIMGIVLANQRRVSIKNIKDFKANLTILMIPVLFILLSARLSLGDIKLMSYMGGIFLLVLIFIGRPLSVFISTVKSNLSLKDKLFISWMAPRGIVAAAVSSVFALKLSEIEIAQVEYLVPLTFTVIIGTVLIYGISSPLAARLLNISQSNPQGVIIAGAQDWALQIASVLREHDFRVVILDTNRYNTNKANMNGLNAYNDSIISDKVIDKINLEGVGKLLALTSNDEVNSMGVLHFSEIFDKENLYQLQPSTKEDEREFSPQHLRGRFLFGKNITYGYITKRIREGASIKSTKLTDKFSFEDFKKKHGESTVPLFLITANRRLVPFTSEGKIIPEKGNIIIALISNSE
ncbi:MAG: cation:proton antiporter [Bacteroidales bacterium]|nr:cation:proton antiporter [Bacteroidales bacterium]